MIVQPVASNATSSRVIGGVVILIPVRAATAASKKADRTNRLVAKKWCCPHRGSRVVFSRWEMSLVSLLLWTEHPQTTQIQEKPFFFLALLSDLHRFKAQVQGENPFAQSV
jgi:hypothetical protein